MHSARPHISLIGALASLLSLLLSLGGHMLARVAGVAFEAPVAAGVAFEAPVAIHGEDEAACAPAATTSTHKVRALRCRTRASCTRVAAASQSRAQRGQAV